MGRSYQMPLSDNFRFAVGPSQSRRLSIAMRDWSRTWNATDLPETIEVRINPRLSRAIARYLKERNLIEVGPRFLKLRSRKAEVMCHEFAHAAAYLLYGNRVRTHGPEWQALVERAGFTPHVRIDIAPERGADKLGSQLTTTYEHRCLVCQMTRNARRPVRQWRCAACAAAGLPGTLEITRKLNP
jgi:predicted SprT family Zn-dependent metalloprotease